MFFLPHRLGQGISCLQYKQGKSAIKSHPAPPQKYVDLLSLKQLTKEVTYKMVQKSDDRPPPPPPAPKIKIKKYSYSQNIHCSENK